MVYSVHASPNCACVFIWLANVITPMCVHGVLNIQLRQRVSQSVGLLVRLSACLSIKTNRNSSNIYINDSRTAMCTYKSQ